MKEFKWIPGFEGYYDINEDGKIRSYRKRTNRGAVLSEEPQVLIKPRVKTNGKNKKEFPAVTLYNGIHKSKFYPSRLVAQLFMGYNPIDKTKQIIFKDGNPMNYGISNLYIGTVSERALNHFRLSAHHKVVTEQHLTKSGVCQGYLENNNKQDG